MLKGTAAGEWERLDEVGSDMACRNSTMGFDRASAQASTDGRTVATGWEHGLFGVGGRMGSTIAQGKVTGQEHSDQLGFYKIGNRRLVDLVTVCSLRCFLRRFAVAWKRLGAIRIGTCGYE